MSGHRSELVRMMAFSVDMRSDGRPSLFQPAIVASSVRSLIGSRLCVMGITGCKRGTDYAFFLVKSNNNCLLYSGAFITVEIEYLLH